MSESAFVVTTSGVIHVPCCPAAQRAKGVLPWSPASQVPGDRRCLRCFPAVQIGRR